MDVPGPCGTRLLKGGFDVANNAPSRPGLGFVGSLFMQPRMAKRAASSLLVIAGLISFAGCQERPVVEQLPAANFNGPLVVAPPPPPPEPVKPQPKVVFTAPAKKPAPAA